MGTYNLGPLQEQPVGNEAQLIEFDWHEQSPRLYPPNPHTSPTSCGDDTCL